MKKILIVDAELQHAVVARGILDAPLLALQTTL